MSEQLYFIKLDENKAKIELSKRLNSECDFSFRAYVDENYEDIKFQEIISKISENIDLLTNDEFLSIYHWFRAKNKLDNPNLDYRHSKDLLKQSMTECGLELFYESPSTSQVRKFHSIMSDYECHIESDINYLCKSVEFNNFLKYGICYTGELRIFLNKKYYKELDNKYDLEFEQKIDEIILNDGKKYRTMALTEFIVTYKYNLETIQLLPPLREFEKSMRDNESYSYPIEFNPILERERDLVSLAWVYDDLVVLWEELKNYTGTVLMIHDC